VVKHLASTEKQKKKKRKEKKQKEKNQGIGQKLQSLILLFHCLSIESHTSLLYTNYCGSTFHLSYMAWTLIGDPYHTTI
jgi:hypothetical protein